MDIPQASCGTLSCWLRSHIGWITLGGIVALIAIYRTVSRALYRYVLRKLKETEEYLELMERLYGEKYPNYGHISMSPDVVVAKCRIFYKLLPLPRWLARLAWHWQENKKKGLS